MSAARGPMVLMVFFNPAFVKHVGDYTIPGPGINYMYLLHIVSASLCTVRTINPQTSEMYMCMRTKLCSGRWKKQIITSNTEASHLLTVIEPLHAAKRHPNPSTRSFSEIYKNAQMNISGNERAPQATAITGRSELSSTAITGQGRRPSSIP